jgi:hypothetical protein
MRRFSRRERRRMMFGRYLAAVVVGLAFIAPAVASAEDAAAAKHHPRSVDARQHRQTKRIRQGVKSGEITKGEANRLRGGEAAIRAEERLYRRSGHGLSPAERRDLQRDLSKTSREIRRAKHNDRQRGDAR